MRPSNYGRGSKFAKPPPFLSILLGLLATPMLPETPPGIPELPELYDSILVRALSILSFLSGSKFNGYSKFCICLYSSAVTALSSLSK